jgi:hypothetical protein
LKHDALPVYDASLKSLDFQNRKMPVFYESSKGHLWANHATWDAYSFAVFAANGSATRHFSVQEQISRSLHASWDGADEYVNSVLRGPTPFEDVSPYIFKKQAAHLSDDLIAKARHYSLQLRVSLEMAWYAMVIVMTLKCLEKSSSGFLYQCGNRSAENADIFGYVTAEVGLCVQVDEKAALCNRVEDVVKQLKAVGSQRENVFPEVAAVHPSYPKFLECSLLVNYVGQSMDTTDRSVITKALGRDDDMIWGPMNWMEIGNESNHEIVFYGRKDVVDFCAEVLLPAMVYHASEGAGGGGR